MRIKITKNENHGALIEPLYSANMFVLRLFIVSNGVLATAAAIAAVKGKSYIGYITFINLSWCVFVYRLSQLGREHLTDTHIIICLRLWN